MKKFFIIFIIMVVILAGALGALTVGVVQHKEAAAKTALKAAVWWVLGFWPEVGDLKLDLKNCRIDVKDLNIRNPEGFPPEEKWMLQVPEISVTYDPASFAQKKLLLKELSVVAKELTIVRSADKEVNVYSLKIVREGRKKAEERAAAPEKAVSTKAPVKIPFKIDRLHLELRWVVYKDYTQAKGPFVQENRVGFNETIPNVTDPNELRRALISMTIPGRLANAFVQYQFGLFAPAVPQFISPQAREGSKILEELDRILLPFVENPKSGKKK
jgi:hypothetical protein